MKLQSDVLAEYRKLGILPVSGGSHQNDDPPDPNDASSDTSTPTTPPPTSPFSDEQQKFVNKLVAAARKEGREAAEQAAKEAAKAAESESERQGQIQRGEFEKAQEGYKAQIASITAEKEALAASIARYEALTQARVTSLRSGIPEEAMEDFPSDADGLSQLEWLENRANLLAKLKVGSGDSSGNGSPPRPPATPPEEKPPKDITEAQKKAISASYKRW